MAAFIFKDSLSKPRFRSDLARPIDALKLFPREQWHSLSFIGAAGLEALHAGIDAREYEIFHNREQMLREQDFAVYHREGEPMTIAFIALGVSVATSVYSIVMAGKMKAPDNLNRTQESAANKIQGRDNQPRLGQRVERIFGQVRTFPSDIMKPYIIYENNEQIEYGAYCVGEGNYLIDDVRDGNTLGKIMGGGWSASFYRPHQNVNEEHPYYYVGDVVKGTKLRTTFESEEAVFAEIDPPNDVSTYIPDFAITGYDASMTAKLVIKDKPDSYDLRKEFMTGEEITFTDLVCGWHKEDPQPIYDENDAVFDFQQWEYVDVTQSTEKKIKYTITDVTIDTLTIDIPASLHADVRKGWFSMNNQMIREFFSIQATEFITYQFFTDDMSIRDKAIHMKSGDEDVLLAKFPFNYLPRIDKIGSHAIGPFAGVDGASIQANIASDGIYITDSDGNDHSMQVEGRIVCREIGDNDEPTGRTETAHWSIQTNTINKKKQVGHSVFMNPEFNKFTVEVIRDTYRDKDSNGQVVDKVNLESLYFFKRNAPEVYGNKTVVLTKRTQSSYGVGKSRKLSMLATSQLVQDNGELKTTRYFDEIICDAAADPTFGRRSPATVAQMRDELKRARLELIDYFGRDDVAYFDYCIDSENITFEAFVKMVASSVFCTPYLKSTLRFSPDVAQPIDSMIFGSANKLVGEESLKYSFDDLQSKKYDCVEIKWRNPANLDAQEAFFVPSQGSNPKTIELNGVRDYAIAQVHGWREWNRIKYQRYSYECLVGLEGTQLIPNQRIGIVNNCCAESLDGYVRAWDGGVNVLLSQEADLSSGGYKITLQNPQGGVGIFDVSQGVDLKHVVLGRAPEFIVNASMKENLTVYRISKEVDLEVDSYQIQEPELTTNGIKIKAVNYSKEIYEKDKTFW